MHDHEVEVNEALVRRLIRSQMPDLADLADQLTVVEPWGTDNAIWRLGDDLTVRLPRIESATKQVELEATWLPRLAPHLTVPIPEPVAVGRPGDDYPYPWAVNRWLPGSGADLSSMSDPVDFADDLAVAVRQLHSIPTTHVGPAPTARNRARPHAGERVWVHADLEGNCLLEDGRLSGIVDWGSACGGDPAVDIQVVWSPLFDDSSRARFLAVLDVDDDTLARSKGAAINQACAALPYYLDTYPLIVERSWHKLAALGVEPVDTEELKR